jgi:hypothetical protein
MPKQNKALIRFFPKELHDELAEGMYTSSLSTASYAFACVGRLLKEPDKKWTIGVQILNEAFKNIGQDKDYKQFVRLIEDQMRIERKDGVWYFTEKKANFIHLAVLLARAPVQDFFNANSNLDIRPMMQWAEECENDPLRMHIREGRERKYTWTGHVIFNVPENLPLKNISLAKAISDLEQTKFAFNDAWRFNNRVGLVV